jgi:hypothetical protein
MHDSFLRNHYGVFMLLLLIIAAVCIASTGYIAFILPLRTIKNSLPLCMLSPGTRICTKTGSLGTITSLQHNRLSVFFDNGNRGVLLPEQIEKII